MAVSDVSICNSALAKLGAARITSLNDDTVEARLLKEQYEKVRDDLLRSHPWNFATERASLALLSSTPSWGFDYQFQLPADCLRVFSMDGEDSYPWKIEGRKLLTDLGECYIKYCKNVTVGSYDANFQEVLACKLAHDICFSIVQSVQLKGELYKDYMAKLREARSYDAQESCGDRVYADTWLNSRS